MKKREILLLLLLTIVIYQGSVYSQSGVGVGLEIRDTSGPIINLIEPLNNSGNIDGNITFFYNVNDSNNVINCSLIINNKINASNTSAITKDIQLSFTLNNTAIGSYNWSINCTDSLGYNSSSAKWTFIVNFVKNFNGSTTNLSLVNVRNITPFVIEVLPYGKINFTDGVDISQGLDLNKYINITPNRIEINSTALTQLNKSATLSLYGLSFSDPRPLRDGAVCPSTICTEVSYLTSGILKNFTFNVTHFTVYSSEETPGVTPPPDEDTGDGTGGGGGGAGGGRTPIGARQFTLSTEMIKVILKQGQTKVERFTIKNTGELTLVMRIDLKEVVDFIIIPPLDYIDVTLQPGGEQTINVSFRAKENLTPDIYPRKIYIKGPEEKIISVVIEVESAKPLFDVDVEVLPEYKSIFPGDEIFMEVSLFNVRGFGRVDVNLEYSIRDFEGNIIAIEHETVAVETQAKFSRELLIPNGIKPGIYIASVKVTFEDSVGLSSDLFEVKAKTIRLYPIAMKSTTFYILLGIIFVVSISIFLIYGSYLSKKRHVPKKKKEKDKLIQKEEKTKKLEKELKALKSAYDSKFISEASYKKDKERIEKVLKRLKG